MKSQKNKTKITKRIWTKLKILSAVFGIGVFWYVFWDDVVSQILPVDRADDPWSNGSIVETLAGAASYVNRGNNSTVIGNYFTGLYYDSVYGFFDLDWSSTPEENVHVVSSTGICPAGYGYKMWGYAYSEDFWLIDFDYNSSTFVYYCEWDFTFKWYAYSDTLGLQSFEGIGFTIIPSITLTGNTTGTGVFVNDVTTIDDIVTFTGSSSNYDYNKIWGDIVELEATEESIFYIIK